MSFCTSGVSKVLSCAVTAIGIVGLRRDESTGELLRCSAGHALAERDDNVPPSSDARRARAGTLSLEQIPTAQGR